MTTPTTFGREPVTIVELDQDFCTLTYGVAPCEAILGQTGSDKCYNTRRTCQDSANYDPESLTLRFCKPMERIPVSWGAIPSLVSVSTSPTRINPGGADSSSGPLGKRATVTITLQDHPDSDFKTDKYVAERFTGEANADGVGFDPRQRGTFWAKWIRRNPYYNGRLLRIRDGYLGQALEDMRVRHYIIDAVDGPDNSGRVTVRGTDILRLTDADKAQAPMGSRGELQAALNDSDVTFDIISATLAEYPETGTLRINDEVMTYTGRTEMAGVITFTGVTRGTDDTEPDDHDEGDTVQLCLRYDTEYCWEVAEDLLLNYAGIPSEFIPSADWDTEGLVWLPQFQVTTLITEPTAVKELLEEITLHCMFYLWWDEIDQEVKLKAIKPETGSVDVLNEDANILKDTQKLTVDPSQRISQLWLYYLPRSPILDMDDGKSFRRLRINIDSDAESTQQYGESRVRKVFSRWLRSDAQAFNVATRLLNRYRDNPQYLTLRVDAKDRVVWTGDVVDVQSAFVVDSTGEIRTARWQVVSAEEIVSGETIQYDLFTPDFHKPPARIWYYTAEAADDYDAADDTERSENGYLADEFGQMSDGSTGYPPI